MRMAVVVRSDELPDVVTQMTRAVQRCERDGPSRDPRADFLEVDRLRLPLALSEVVGAAAVSRGQRAGAERHAQVPAGLRLAFGDFDPSAFDELDPCTVL